MWWLTRDCDKECLVLYDRHYSADPGEHRDRGGFGGPGERIVLRTINADALFVWRFDTRPADRIRRGRDRGEQGVYCGVFRNESRHQSSELIRQADAIADLVWSHRRHYTYVDPKGIRSRLPGACFLAAGWRYVRQRGHRVRTKSGLLILERWRDGEDREVRD